MAMETVVHGGEMFPTSFLGLWTRGCFATATLVTCVQDTSLDSFKQIRAKQEAVKQTPYGSK